MAATRRIGDQPRHLGGNRAACYAAVVGTKDELVPPPGGAAGLPAAAVTAQVTRGVRRWCDAQGWATVTEVSLANSRRADVLAVDHKGVLTIIEVKSSRSDFLSDHKWPDYLPYCDRFCFAVPEGFAVDLLPAEPGILVADAYDAAVLREAPIAPLPAARRKAMLLRFAHAASARLMRWEDPPL